MLTVTKTFQVRTFGCQMNVHDSERIAGMLEAAGYRAYTDDNPDLSEQNTLTAGPNDPAPDVVVFNTCAVRENAAERLYGTLGLLRQVKKTHPGMQIAVGGCLAQKDRDAVLTHSPWVDVVFGTHTLASLPALLERSRHNGQAHIEIAESLEAFPSVLPAKRESAYSSWVSISVGCNNTCTFCIVPSLRGKEVDRRPVDIIAEVTALVDQGVEEVTLLGQNVNAYGVHFADPDLPRDRFGFSALLREVAQVEGLRRLRFTSPHPAEFTSDVIDAMAENPVICPSLHMPLQSGSDAVLKRMRRSYRTQKFFSILDEVREKIPNAAITTDIIVGFPGETEEDFGQTLDAVRRARFASAFTFQYSPRPGTPAAEYPDQVPADIVSDRYMRLHRLQEQISAEENQRLVGETVELLVQAESGKKDQQSHRMSGRARDGRLVHFTPQAASMVVESTKIRPGDYVTVTVTESHPHFLIADAGYLSHERTRAGDNWEAGQVPTTPPNPGEVNLGMPGGLTVGSAR